MVAVEFSERAKERFLSLEERKQAAVSLSIEKAKDNPEETLDSTTGYAEYRIEIPMNPEEFVICLDWDKEAERLYVLTLGAASAIND